MNALLELRAEIESTNEGVARAQRALALHPEIPSAKETLRAIVQRRERLEAEFAAAAKEAGRDVCKYAIETDDPIPAMRDITNVWGTFQRLFTTVYDVVVSGAPKQIEKFSETILEKTKFGFGYTFPGSIGVVMTVDPGDGLVPDTALDTAMKNVFDIISVRRPEDVIEVNRRFGLAAVRIAREWAAENARAGFGANVEWRGTEPMPRRLRLQSPEINQLESAIDRAAEYRTETIPGELVVVNYEERTFQMRLSPELAISGTYDDAVSIDRPAQVPHRYKAEMQISRRIISKGEEDRVSYFLVRLDPE
jgi:hypothetical protein